MCRYLVKMSFWLLALSFLFTGTAFAVEPIAIIAPMLKESGYLKSHIDHIKLHKSSGMRYFSGTIAGQPVILIDSGIGEVNAAATTTWLYCMIHPKLVILTGTSGGVNPKLKVGDVIVGNRVFDADYGRLTGHGQNTKMIGSSPNPNSGTVEPVYFHPGQQFHDLLKKVLYIENKHFTQYNFAFGTIATSDALPNSARQAKRFLEDNVDVVAMEDAAVDKVCWLYHISCINIRGVSDVGISSNKQWSRQATILSARNAASVAVKFIEMLPKKNVSCFQGKTK